MQRIHDLRYIYWERHATHLGKPLLVGEESSRPSHVAKSRYGEGASGLGLSEVVHLARVLGDVVHYNHIG